MPRLSGEKQANNLVTNGARRTRIYMNIICDVYLASATMDQNLPFICQSPRIILPREKLNFMNFEGVEKFK